MPRSAREFVADYIAAMNRHDVEGVMSCFADDSAYEDAAIGAVRRGRAEIEEFVAFFLHCYQGVKYTLHSVVGDDERIAWEWTLEATYARISHTGVPATGQKVRLRGASFMRVRDSLAVWNTDYWDINTMRRQIEAGSG
jgi:steroid delta-isomerase-like uncharacterized protein